MNWYDLRAWIHWWLRSQTFKSWKNSRILSSHHGPSCLWNCPAGSLLHLGPAIGCHLQATGDYKSAHCCSYLNNWVLYFCWLLSENILWNMENIFRWLNVATLLSCPTCHQHSCAELQGLGAGVSTMFSKNFRSVSMSKIASIFFSYLRILLMPSLSSRKPSQGKERSLGENCFTCKCISIQTSYFKLQVWKAIEDCEAIWRASEERSKF